VDEGVAVSGSSGSSGSGVSRRLTVPEPTVPGNSASPGARTTESVRWPSVTAVVPTLGDRADLLERTLLGIRDQDYPGAVDCVVVLDRRSPDAAGWKGSGPQAPPGGTDTADDTRRWESTRRVAKAAGAKVIDNQRTPGLAGTRNTGILAASGELVAFCDDDDRWLPGKLRAQVTALAAEPAAVIACCGIRLEYGDMVITRVHPDPVVSFRDLLRSRLMELHVSSFLARRSALLNGVGLVSEEIPGSRAEDYEFLLRAARHGPVLNVPEPWVHVMWHTQRRAMYGRWPIVVQALPWLLEKYPEFRTVPAGYARIAGQIAFAAAASGKRTMALKWCWSAARANPRELRPYIALGVASGLVKPDSVVRWLHRTGRGM
jgi:glycosyltransferase involved in cell wall biosynthesis